METDQNLFLVENYVGVCNKALQNNRDRFPFKQIFEAAQKEEYGRKIEVQLYDLDVVGRYIFEFTKNGIDICTHDECNACACDRQWKLDKSYVYDVISSPDSYVDNPALLNWEWMFDQL